MAKRIALFIVLPALFSTAESAAQSSVDSANWVMPGCRAILADKSEEAFKAGVCAGVTATLRALGATSKLGYCVPVPVTNGQAIQVAVNYIDRQPSRWHERFDVLTIQAFREVWPCR